MGDWLEIEELESERFILLPGWWTRIKKYKHKETEQEMQKLGQERQIGRQWGSVLYTHMQLG